MEDEYRPTEMLTKDEIEQLRDLRKKAMKIGREIGIINLDERTLFLAEDLGVSPVAAFEMKSINTGDKVKIYHTHGRKRLIFTCKIVSLDEELIVGYNGKVTRHIPLIDISFIDVIERNQELRVKIRKSCSLDDIHADENSGMKA